MKMMENRILVVWQSVCIEDDQGKRSIIVWIAGGVNCGVFSLNCNRADWKNGGNYGSMIMESYVQKRGVSVCILLFVTISSTSWTI